MELNSNVLATDDNLLREREQRAVFDKPVDKLPSSVSGWNSDISTKKPINAGAVDTYKAKQNQLGSSVLPQNDYSSYAPIQKSNIDMNQLGHRGDPRNPMKPKTDVNINQPSTW